MPEQALPRWFKRIAISAVFLALCAGIVAIVYWQIHENSSERAPGRPATPPTTAGQAEPARASSFHYVYRHRDEALPLDVTRVAVWRDGPRAAAPDWKAYGLDAADVTPHGMPGWSLVSTPESARSEQGVRTLVEQLDADENLDFVSPVFRDRFGGPLLITPTQLIRFKDGVAAHAAERILAGAQAGKILERNYAGMKNAYQVHSQKRNGLEVLDVTNALSQNPEVQWAEPDLIFTGRTGAIPNDSLFSTQWGLNNTGQSGGTANMDMDVPEAWDVTSGSASITIVVFDSGVQLNHPDLNLAATHTDLSPENGGGGPVGAYANHGTCVAGCITARFNNSLGVAGVAPGCKVASAKIGSNYTSQGSFQMATSVMVSALQWGQSIGAKVTNNSNGFGAASSSIDDMYTQTRNAGQLHFAAAGNESVNTVGYPASSPSVCSVMALNRTGARASFSNAGSGIDFAAPGEEIESTDRTGGDGYISGDYVSIDGTSFASPYAAGVAALIFSQDPSRTPSQVEQIMRSSCKDLGNAGYDTTFGYGLVCAGRALGTNPGTPTAPAITSQPANQTVAAGQTATFSIVASGAAPLTYQWQKNGSGITGATASSYTTPAVAATDNGAQYRCVVSNGQGSATSNAAVLTVSSSGPVQLFSGVSVAGSVTQGIYKYYFIDVPTGATQLLVETTGPTTSDADLYVSNTSTFTVFLSSEGATCNESIAVVAQSNPALAAGRWYCAVYGYSASANYSIRATVTVPVANHPPVIASAAGATPNPATAGQAVSFSVAATDSDGDALAYAWNFGDGSSGSGSAPSHVYSTAGTFTAALTVSDGKSSVGDQVTVTVNAGNSDPAGLLFLTALRLTVNFATAGRDTCKLLGQLEVPMNFNPTGATVRLNVGGAITDFVLDSTGKGSSINGNLYLRASQGLATVTALLKQGNWASQWVDEGLVNQTVVGAYVTMPVTLTVNGTVYDDELDLLYFGRAGRSGRTR